MAMLCPPAPMGQDWELLLGTGIGLGGRTAWSLSWSFPGEGPRDDSKDREALRCPRRMGIVLTSRDGAMGGPQNRRVKNQSLTDSFKLLADVS